MHAWIAWTFVSSAYSTSSSLLLEAWSCLIQIRYEAHKEKREQERCDGKLSACRCAIRDNIFRPFVRWDCLKIQYWLKHQELSLTSRDMGCTVWQFCFAETNGIPVAFPWHSCLQAISSEEANWVEGPKEGQWTLVRFRSEGDLLRSEGGFTEIHRRSMKIYGMSCGMDFSSWWHMDDMRMTYGWPRSIIISLFASAAELAPVEVHCGYRGLAGFRLETFQVFIQAQQ